MCTFLSLAGNVFDAMALRTLLFLRSVGSLVAAGAANAADLGDSLVRQHGGPSNLFCSYRSWMLPPCSIEAVSFRH